MKRRWDLYCTPCWYGYHQSEDTVSKKKKKKKHKQCSHSDIMFENPKIAFYVLNLCAGAI